MPFSRPCQLNNNNKRDYENEREFEKLNLNIIFLFNKKKYEDEETKSQHHKKTSEVKIKILPEGNNNIYITKNQKLETKTNCNSSYQKHHLPTKKDKYRHLLSMLSKNS